MVIRGGACEWCMLIAKEGVAQMAYIVHSDLKGYWFSLIFTFLVVKNINVLVDQIYQMFFGFLIPDDVC